MRFELVCTIGVMWCLHDRCDVVSDKRMNWFCDMAVDCSLVPGCVKIVTLFCCRFWIFECVKLDDGNCCRFCVVIGFFWPLACFCLCRDCGLPLLGCYFRFIYIKKMLGHQGCEAWPPRV